MGIGCIGWGSAMAIIAVTTAAQAVDSVEMQGQTILEMHCSRCHAIGAEGASTHPQAPPFREVVGRYPPATLAESLAEGIVTGHPDMPELSFQPPEIEAIIAYLEKLKAGQPAK